MPLGAGGEGEARAEGWPACPRLSDSGALAPQPSRALIGCHLPLELPNLASTNPSPGVNGSHRISSSSEII